MKTDEKSGRHLAGNRMSSVLSTNDRTIDRTVLLTFRLFSTKFAKAPRALCKRRNYKMLGRCPQWREWPESRKKSISYQRIPLQHPRTANRTIQFAELATTAALHIPECIPFPHT